MRRYYPACLSAPDSSLYRNPIGGVLLFGGHITDPAAAFDAGRRALVVFGGIDVATNTLFDETWELRDGAWRQARGPNPGPRDHHAMAYDAARQKVVLFGGSSNDGKGAAPHNYLADTWEWHGARWTEVKPSAAPWPASQDREP